MRFIIDAETDGHLDELTKFHCLGVRDFDSDYSELLVGNEAIKKWLHNIKLTRDVNIFIGHNIFGFDNEAFKKVFGIDLLDIGRIEDTFVLSQLFYGDIKGLDFSKFEIPGEFIGRHSLAAWGHRLKCYKGGYEGDFKEYTEEMGQYCLRDTEVTKKLALYLESVKKDRILRDDCIALEYAIAPILARQQAKGVLFNKEAAEELLAILLAEKARLKGVLQSTFKQRVLDKGTVVPKVSSKKYYTKKGCAYTKIQFQEYNPSSRQQTIDRLCSELGWTPEEFTEKGNPSLDEEIIESLPFPQAQPIKDYFIVNQRLGQLSNGKNSWLNMVKADSRIHGGIMQSGTITGRMAHFRPNMNVPSKDKPYGKECRALFHVPKGKIQIGCDADALEMRTMGGFLKPFDGGAFIKTLLEGKKEDGTDMHSVNSRAYQVDKYQAGRDCSKTLFYGSIYGAGDAKRGLILQQFGVDFEDYVPDFEENCKSLKRWTVSKNIEWSEQYIRCFVAGRLANERFGEQIPALPRLIKDVVDKHEKNGFLRGLDGRKLKARKKASIFNTLNQSAGAIIMKKALQIADNDLQLELCRGRDYEFILNVHDEWGLEVEDNPDIIKYVCEVLPKAMEKGGEYFSFAAPMKGNIQIGRNWNECH